MAAATELRRAAAGQTQQVITEQAAAAAAVAGFLGVGRELSLEWETEPAPVWASSQVRGDAEWFEPRAAVLQSTQTVTS